MKTLSVVRIAGISVLALSTMIFSPFAFSQSATGRVAGLITDPSGAAVAGATIGVANVATGALAKASSGPDGRYEALDLPVGSYKVTVQHAGFETAVTPPNDLQINQTLRVDVRLALGAVSQIVAVEATATQVETENPTIGGTIVGAAVQELPLNGRDPMSLLQTQPGVAGTFTGASNGAGGNGGSIAGGRNDNVSFLLDGGNNNVVRSSALNFNPNPDAVAEFRVLMNNYTAEYGRSGGGVVSVVTKSGTNQFHGSLFEYVRNTDFNANNFFLNSAGQPRAILQRNQFGATFGGPVWIPHVFHGKDKLFFFFSYQGQRQNQTAVGGVSTVYTSAELKGDFSQAVNGKPDPNVVAFLQKYPYMQPNAALAAQGIIDPTKLSSVFQNYISANLVASSATGSYIPTSATQTNYDQYSSKVDYLLTPQDRISTTLGYQNNPSIPTPNPGFPLATTNTNYFITLDYTKTIRPTLLNDFRISVTRLLENENNPTTATPGPNALGININPDLSLGSTEISMPSGYVSMGYNPNNAILTDTNYNYSDTLTWIKGSHTFKGGFSLIAAQENSNYNFETMGGFSFGGASTSIGSGNPLADFAMGLPDSFSQYPSAFSNMRSKTYGGFFQDEWKVNRRLQLTIGLRYEYGTPQKDLLGRTFSLVPGDQSQRFVSAPLGAVFPGDPGAPSGLYFPDKNNFAPRFGVAWDPFGDGKTSIRTGIGVFYNILNGWIQDENNGVPPYYAGVSFSSNPLATLGSLPQFLNNPYGAYGQPNPFPSHATLSSSDPNLLTELADFPFGNGNWFVNPHLRTPYVFSYNFSVERQLARSLVLDVSYVGSSSHSLTNMEDGNPIILGTDTRILNQGIYPKPSVKGWAALPDYVTNDGRANYNALLATLTKRFSDTRFVGTTFFTAAYTWSHNIDNGSGAITSSSGNIPYYNHNALRGNSAYDQRQRFTLSGGWELPFAKAFTKVPKALTSGWTLYPIFNWYTGLPFDLSAGLSEGSAGTKPGASGAGDNQLDRVLLLTPTVQTFDPHTPQTMTSGTTSRTGLYYFNPFIVSVPSTWNSASYIPTPAQMTYGMPRDSIPGIGVINLDLALAKRTMLFKERVGTEFRVEAFNTLNHTEFGNPNTSRTSPLYGQVTSVLGNRVLQLALRIQF
jgi:hypothetical protein